MGIWPSTFRGVPTYRYRSSTYVGLRFDQQVPILSAKPTCGTFVIVKDVRGAEGTEQFLDPRSKSVRRSEGRSDKSLRTKLSDLTKNRKYVSNRALIISTLKPYYNSKLSLNA